MSLLSSTLKIFQNLKYKSIKSQLFIQTLILAVVTGLLYFFYRDGIAAKCYIIDDASLIQIPQLRNSNLFELFINFFKDYKNHIDFYPLRDVSYWIDIHLFNADTNWKNLAVFRAHNFFLFFSIGVSLLFLLKELKLNTWLGFLILLTWFIHPYHAELIMWVTSRKDLLGILYSILFLNSYLKFLKLTIIQSSTLYTNTSITAVTTTTTSTTIPSYSHHNSSTHTHPNSIPHTSTSPSPLSSSAILPSPYFIFFIGFITLLFFFATLLSKTIFTLNAVLIGGLGIGFYYVSRKPSAFTTQFVSQIKAKSINPYFLYFHVILLLISVVGSFWAKYFYSTINDMRFKHDFYYRLVSTLAALGRTITGWVLPSVNSIDVFNWGDWWNHNQRFIPVGLVFWFVFIGLIIFIFLRRRYVYLIYFGAFLGVYLPVSGLIFPHRNFYSVRYMEFPFLILVFAGISSLTDFKKQSQKKILVSTLIYLVIPVLFWLQFVESKYWLNDIAVVEKALSLDPTNPSLLTEKWLVLKTEGSHQESLLLPECESKIIDPNSPGKNGDLCWFYVVVKYNFYNSNSLFESVPKLNSNSKLDSNSKLTLKKGTLQSQTKHPVRSKSKSNSVQERQSNSNRGTDTFRQWRLRHARMHSDNYFQIESAFLEYIDFVQGRTQGLSVTPPPLGFFNHEMGRMLYLSAQCLVQVDQKSQSSYWEELISFNLLDEMNWHYFLIGIPEPNRSKIQHCFKNDLRHHFTNKKWIQALKDKETWWFELIQKGAPGLRYGCGYDSINGYDCGSTMDQASMVNLYTELYRKTGEKGFLKEAFYYAKNGNQMCSIMTTEERPCGDGKAQGTWLMSLLKLFLITKDINILKHLHSQLKLDQSKIEIYDQWDFFEVYRSYYIGNLIRPEAIPVQLFADLEKRGLDHKLITAESLNELKIILECAYTKECQSPPTFHLSHFESPPVVSSLIEILVNLNGMDWEPAPEWKEKPLWELSPLWGGRRFIARCGFENDHLKIQQMISNYKDKKYNELPKPYFYSEEGDNISPFLIMAYNEIFAKESSECAHWEISPQVINRIPLYYTYGEIDDFLPKRRSVFILSQVKAKNKLRLWMINNTNNSVRLTLEPGCLSLASLKVTLAPKSQVERIVDVKNKFNLDSLRSCWFKDSLGKTHSLFP